MPGTNRTKLFPVIMIPSPMAHWRTGRHHGDWHFVDGEWKNLGFEFEIQLAA